MYWCYSELRLEAFNSSRSEVHSRNAVRVQNSMWSIHGRQTTNKGAKSIVSR